MGEKEKKDRAEGDKKGEGGRTRLMSAGPGAEGNLPCSDSI